MDSDLRELSPTERYERRTVHFLEEVKRLEAQSRGYSNLRLMIFVVGVISVLIVPKNTPFWILLLTALLLLLLILFIAAAIRHQVIEGQLETSREMARRNEEGKARIARNWKDLLDRPPPVDLVSSSLARDLDLFGRASLFDLLCTASTWEGRKAVAKALLSGIARENLSARHAAIRELAPKLEFRQLLECGTLPLRKSAAPGNVLFTHLQVHPTLLQQGLRRWFYLLSPLALVILLVLNLAGILPRWPFGLLITFNFAVSFRWGRVVRKNLRSAMSVHRSIGYYVRAFRCLMEEPLSSPELVSLQKVAERAFTKMRRLEGLLSFSKPSQDIPVLPNALFFWDLHLAMALQKWWQENGEALSDWITAFGKLEEICSFASLLHDNPRWSFPEFMDDNRIVATGLGHPLLSEERRVDNDVGVGPEGRILMVTGSNMSGKTTLLRAIGINVLLAKAGSPVCAKKLVLPWVDVVTSMRAMDSVTDGVSLFMAELASIKAVADAAKRVTRAGAGLVLYLLDEILLGTNIDERRVITCRLIQNLLQQRAIGAMSTHDLSLLHFKEFASQCQNIHFQETFVSNNGQLEMAFDYRIRDGEARSRNAIALMKHIGLDLKE
jgi:hypothetical protein